jgi:uroporphyrinogen decarboxylase
VKPILDVLSGRKPSRRPLWVMRQAGRYLPEYRALRVQAGSFLKLCYNPELACEVTLQPLRRYDFDAAILFSDILVVPHAMGLTLDFREGEGPVLDRVFDLTSVQRLFTGEASEQFGKVYETVARVNAALDQKQTLIGFCGGPWTVASYMIEGGSSKRQQALAVAMANPAWFQLLMARLVQSSVVYLLGQIKAGAEVVQVFDSWAGDVPLSARQRVVVDPIAAIVDGVRKVHANFPVIVFARGLGSGHGDIARLTGASAVGVEEDVNAGEVLATLPGHVALQGNMSSNLLLGAEGDMLFAVKRILAEVPAHRHIFNLGHGIQQQTSPEMVGKFVAAVRAGDA